MHAIIGLAISGSEGDVPMQALCRQIAVQMLRARVLRQRLLRDLPGSDPAWDMVLDLYVAEGVGRPVSVSDLALAAAVPRSTGLRWVALLVEEGHLERECDPHDGRRSFVKLSEHTRAVLDRYLAQSAAPMTTIAAAIQDLVRARDEIGPVLD